MKKEREGYIHSVIDATLETMPGVDKLRHSFQSGIDSLADGILKSELHNNFDVYFKQLQR